jgi:hypothetical protein
MAETQIKKETQPKELWTRYRVTWDFPGNLCGSVPKDPNLIEPWLESRKPAATSPYGKSIPEIQEEIISTLGEPEEPIEEEIKRMALGFQHLNGEMVMRGATVRAHLKDCARIVGTMYVGRLVGQKQFSTKIINGVYNEEYWIPVTRHDGTPVSGPDGSREIMVHARGPQGPINALKRVDFVTDVRMVFTLKVMSGIHRSDLDILMQYGAVHGYAGERSMGEGRYVYAIEQI